MSVTKNRSRLGKGLSALINAPVQVATEARADEAPRTPRSTSAPLAAPAEALNQPAPRSGGDALRSILVSKLKPNTFQPRRSFDQAGLERLAESIRTTGMMQPIVARVARGSGPSGPWEIIAGERRWRAARIAGLEAVPVIVSEVDDRGAAEWALVENLQREDLNPIDRALAFRGLADRFGLSHAEIAERVGLDRSSVANLIRIVDLEPEIQEMVRDAALSTGHAKALLAFPAGAARIKLAAAARAGEWSVRHLEAQVKLQLDKGALEPTREPDANRTARAAGRDELERQLSEHLGTKVQIKTNSAGDKGTLVIAFFGVDHFDSLMERFGFELRS